MSCSQKLLPPTMKKDHAKITMLQKISDSFSLCKNFFLHALML